MAGAILMILEIVLLMIKNYYSRELLFKRTIIQEINYNPGCHSNASQGILKVSGIRYPLFHYKYINKNVFVKKQQVNRARDTEKQRRHNWGGACYGGDAYQAAEYEQVKKSSVQILFDHKHRKPV